LTVALFERGPLLTGGPAEMFAAARVVYFATCDGEGRPHVVPVSPLLDLDHVIFASELETVKVRNVLGNPSVSMCVDEYDDDWERLRAVVVFGEGSVIEAGFEWERDRNLLYEKYPQYPEQAPIEEGTNVMIDVRIDRIVTWGF
jgi:nitroimidazol reductase NimA-like FMN-containing flavoprotein (pyridoxamine 5'-phosphate oxidase superfamily)